jgi:CRISPR associated protein
MWFFPGGRDRNSKPGCAGAFVAVRFDGVLVVTDPALFKTAVASGIGSGKASGFGLLSFAPLGGSPPPAEKTCVKWLFAAQRRRSAGSTRAGVGCTG